MKSKIVNAGISKVVLAGMLATVLVMSFAASPLLVQEGRLERGASSALAAGGARVLKDASFSAPAGGAHQSIPAPPRHSVFLAIFPGFGTVLAAGVLVLPFGLSTLRILRRKRVA